MIQRACGAAGFMPAVRARSSDFPVPTALVAAPAAPVTRTVPTAVRTGTARRPEVLRVREPLHAAAVIPVHTP